MTQLLLDRRSFAGSLIGLLLSAPAFCAEPEFAAFLETLWPSAQTAGVSRATFDMATGGLEPERGVLSKPKTQAEFTISIPAYVAAAVTSQRVARGRSAMAEMASVLASLRGRHGVPPEILVAVWGVESAYGGGSGGSDALRVLATLAWKGARREVFSAEFVAALVMLERGLARREQLRGSWAGAMGQPQFLPSAYLKYAESYSGDAVADIWDSRADALASIANFLHKSGWRPDLPPVIETVLPSGFDYANVDLDFAQWRQLGFAQADGAPLPSSGPASLYLPAGATGPAFLITDNFEVIRQYNTSDAYALSVALLAERIAGRTMPYASWPKLAPLSTAECMEMQRLLTKHGYYEGPIDGKLGRSSRNAVHAFQRAQGLAPADGLATREVVARLKRL